MADETVVLSTGRALRRACQNAVWMPTVLASLIATIGLVMSAGFALAGLQGPRPVVLQIAILPAMLFGSGWALFFVIAAPMSFAVSLSTKHRRIWIEGWTLFHRTSCNTRKLPLEKCCWMVSETASDIGGRYFGSGPLIQVQAEQQWVVCGFSEDAREQWVRVLTELGVDRVVPAERRMLWLRGSAITMTTMTAGAAVGAAVSSLTGQPLWLVSGALIGSADGVVLSMGALYWARRGTRVTSRFRPHWCALIFTVIALKCAIGFEGRLMAGLINAALGWFCGRYITQQARKHVRRTSPPILRES